MNELSTNIDELRILVRDKDRPIVNTRHQTGTDELDTDDERLNGYQTNSQKKDKEDSLHSLRNISHSQSFKYHPP